VRKIFKISAVIAHHGPPSAFQTIKLSRASLGSKPKSPWQSVGDQTVRFKGLHKYTMFVQQRGPHTESCLTTRPTHWILPHTESGPHTEPCPTLILAKGASLVPIFVFMGLCLVDHKFKTWGTPKPMPPFWQNWHNIIPISKPGPQNRF
jgi:hypothetical protein